MKILNIHTSLGMGGTERAAVNFCLGYNSLGIESRFLVIYGAGPRIAELEKNSIYVYDYSKNSHCIQEIITWNPDILHCHRSLYFDYHIIDLIDKIKTKNTFIVETNVFSRYDYSQWYKNNINLSFQLSNWCLWKYNRWRGSSSRPESFVIPYPLITEQFKRASEKDIYKFKAFHDLPSNAFIVGRIGQPINSKWSEHTVDSFILASKKICNLYLVLVGAPLLVLNQIKRLPQNLQLKTRIIEKIEGDDQLSDCYSSMDIFLHSSKIGESFGLVLAESMLCGTPVITLATPLRDNSQIEVVGHNIGGLIANSADEMANQMIYLYNNPSILNQFGLNARAGIISRFDYRVIATQLIQIYSKCKEDKMQINRIEFQDLRKISILNNTHLSFLTIILLNFLHNPFANKIIRQLNFIIRKFRLK